MRSFKEFKERVKLAWNILKDHDGNILDHAKRELQTTGYYDEPEGMNQMMAENMIDLLRTFSTHGHSGFSAFFACQLFSTMVKFEPLGPLTGKDEEWAESFCNEGTQQNKRCSHVFKDKTGHIYDIQAVIFEEPNGCTFTGRHSRQTVTMPYMPVSVTVKVSEDASDLEKQTAAKQAWASRS